LPKKLLKFYIKIQTNFNKKNNPKFTKMATSGRHFCFS
jgi:hypothetical protein